MAPTAQKTHAAPRADSDRSVPDRAAGFQALREIVLKVLPALSPGELPSGLSLPLIVRAWARAVGDPTARHCQVVGVRRWRLELVVDSPVLQEELELMASALLERLNLYTGLRLTTLQIRVGRVQRTPIPASSAHNAVEEPLEIPEDLPPVRPELRARIHRLMALQRRKHARELQRQSRPARKIEG